MYCQKCGRKLKSGMRFCDYCGQPVGTASRTTGRTTSTKTRTAASKSSGTDVSQKRAQYERNKKRRELERKKAQKNRRIALFAILIAIVAAVVLYFVSNNLMQKELDKGGGLQAGSSNESIETTKEPQEEEKTTNTSASTNKDEEQESKQESKQEKTEEKTSPYSDTQKDFSVLNDDTMDELSCAYPKSFTKETTRGNDAVWSGADENGDGSLIIYSKHVGTSKQASKLLTEYEKGLGADKITDKESDPESYTITYERNGKITHRKAVLSDGMCIYYDFSYQKGSDNTTKYKKYIEYMDYYLDQELKSLKEDSAKKS